MSAAQSKSLQFARHLREFASNLRRHLEHDENAGQPQTARTYRGASISPDPLSDAMETRPPNLPFMRTG